MTIMVKSTSEDSPHLGIRHKEVLDLLQDRKKRNCSPGHRNDPAKIALVIEGGAMAGILSSSAATAFENLGFYDCFDAVYGTSSGALNAAYFVAGQSAVCTSLYYENAIDPQFMKLFRWPDQVDVNWLARNWVRTGKKLDVNHIMDSACELHISATNTKTGQVRFFSNRNSAKEVIIPAIIASSSTPMFVTHQEKIGDHLYNDGMLRAAIPVQQAIKDGATHIVALLTSKVGCRKRFSPYHALLEHFLRLRHYSADYQSAFHARSAFYNDAIDLIFTPNEGVRTLAITPPVDLPRTRHLERRADVLKVMVDQCKDNTLAILEK